MEEELLCSFGDYDDNVFHKFSVVLESCCIGRNFVCVGFEAQPYCIPRLPISVFRV